MSEKNMSVSRFVIPLVLISAGIMTLALNLGSGFLLVSEYQTLGFIVFTVGVFSLLVITSRRYSQLVTDGALKSISQGLVVYGGFVSALLFEGIITLQTSVTAVMIVFGFGLLSVILA